jgi:AraC-like DNA-binding protein
MLIFLFRKKNEINPSRNCKKPHESQKHQKIVLLGMDFPTILPSEELRPYVKYYWVCTTEEDVFKESMYPSGHLEFCIDISNGETFRHFDSRSERMPKLEMLGHITIPTSATVAKGTTVLVTRFHPHASSLFVPNRAIDFTNRSIDLYDILGHKATDFYNQVIEQPTVEKKVRILEAFLIQQLNKNRKKQEKLKLIEHICSRIGSTEFFNSKSLSMEFGFSERYIQKSFLECVGLTPKNYFAVQRFNKSLELVQSSTETLTSIALECGYYDQAHFIKEFKSYTALTPSSVRLIENPIKAMA